MWQAFVSLLSGLVKAWNDRQAAKRDAGLESTGATKQREQILETENKAMADDRVRAANPDLQQRVRADHGIETGTEP